MCWVRLGVLPRRSFPSSWCSANERQRLGRDCRAGAASGPVKRFLPSAARADGAVGETMVVPPYQTPGTDGSPSPFRFAEIVEAVRRQWITILLVAVAVLSPGVYWIRREVPIFKAEATIRLRDVQGELTGGLAGGSFGDLTRSVDPVKSQMEVLTSRAVATQVVDSAPELRVVAIGFPASGLDSLRLKPEVT